MAKTRNKVREVVTVHLDAHDRVLLERLAKKTGLPRTEVLREKPPTKKHARVR